MNDSATPPPADPISHLPSPTSGRESDLPARTEPRILVVDIETTSLDARAGSILEIGAVWIMGGEGEFHGDCQIWPGATLDPQSLRINGWTSARCTDPVLLKESELLLEFKAWVGEEPFLLAGLNPSHDRAFLMEALRRSPAGFFKWIGHRSLDLHTLAVAYAVAQGSPTPSRGYYTDEIYALLDLPPEPKPHSAITGARREAEAFRMLLGLPEIGEPIPYEFPDSAENDQRQTETVA